MRSAFLKVATSLISLFTSAAVLSQPGYRLLEKPKAVDDFLSLIPARESNLAAVMRTYGLRASSIAISPVTTDDVNDGTFLNKKGDISVTIDLVEPVMASAECPVQQPIYLTRRGGRYLADTRTANFLLHRVCEAPNR